MPIDIEQEELISLAEAAKIVPGRPHISTIWRWCTKPNRYGKVLDTVVRGGSRFTSASAVRRYIDETTRAANGQAPQPTSGRKQDRIAQAERDAAAMGV